MNTHTTPYLVRALFLAGLVLSSVPAHAEVFGTTLPGETTVSFATVQYADEAPAEPHWRSQPLWQEQQEPSSVGVVTRVVLQSAEPRSVPEPAQAALFVGGLICLLLCLRRPRKRSQSSLADKVTATVRERPAFHTVRLTRSPI
ncbi:hypothetical protein ACG0Z6_12865 [Roseateles sp. BYS180W]|uniref:PEP-CTERM protein-sorting domain-containing protein n=1 Tax=Roseateles rivi TaxID=3299028 RepID=A0ABW7FXV0_9BURK